MEVATHCLMLPGNVLNLSTLLDKKKFRVYGSKAGAIKGFKYLENDHMGNLELCGGRGVNKVTKIRQTITVTLHSSAFSCIISRKGHCLQRMILRGWLHLQPN